MRSTTLRGPGWVAQGLRVSRGASGSPGAHPVPGGVRFTVSAPGAQRVDLVLLDPADGSVRTEIPFPDDYRSGDVFTMTVGGLPPGDTHYGYRATRVGEDGTPVPGPLLLDPYATVTAGAETWGERPRHRSVRPAAPDDPDDFDWGPDRRPGIPAEDLVIYELHVRGYTRHPSAGVTAPGTYAGLREKIPYLRTLGVNCVELLPLFEFDETDNTYVSPETGQPLRNFWGYNTIAYFSPKAGYAADPAGSGPARELKALVRDLHLAGIEVILDVVFNHTAEGDHRGPAYSFRGLDEAGFYLLAPGGGHLNLTATGNTVNANHPRTRAFILDCLRYWADTFHIDGFRFDMASILTRGGDGEPLANPPLLEAITHDPVLAHCKLIAEPIDATGLDQVGSFPAYGRWMEWNGRYRDAARRFLAGHPGSAGQLATRLLGSRDLYGERGATASVNYITCHDGLTLADLTTYDHRHNEANGEGGTDGIPDEVSWNCGHEGPTDDPAVTALRHRQIRNALLLLLVSNGVPMLLAGDEFARTQRGNNNAYCQDNEISWLDWRPARSRAGLTDFVRHCLAFRRAHPVLRGAAPAEVSWHGTAPGQPDWSDESRLVALMLHGQDPDGAQDTVYVAANGSAAPVTVTLPPPPDGTRWRLFADTAARDGRYARPPALGLPVLHRDELLLEHHSAVVLTARPTATDRDRPPTTDNDLTKGPSS